MLDKSFGLLFYLKKPKGYIKGALPIYLRITVDEVPKELSTKRSCDPIRWNSKAERASGTKEEVKALNTYLDTFEARVYEVKRQLIENYKLISASAIKEMLLGINQRDKMLIEIFESYNENVKKLIGKDYSQATWEKYDRTCRFTRDFIKTKYKSNDFPIQNLNLEFVNQYEIWLKTVRNCGQNAAMKYISILKMIVIYCINNEWLLKDPFANFKIRKEEVIPEFLMEEEIDVLLKKEIKIERLRQVRDIFVFCCYTGLAYVDVAKLNVNEVNSGIDKNLWILTRRGKTNIPSPVPLLPVAQEIIKKYQDHPQCVNNGKVLPVLSNQKYNSYLKELADICGITKNLTTHTARHTFATTVTLNNGVPIESVSKMLGHKKLQTTQHYAKVLNKKLGEDMQVLKEKLLQRENSQGAKEENYSNVSMTVL